MSRFRLTFQRPSHTVINYGVDHQRGYFCTVVRGGVLVAEYDSRSPGYDGIEGLLSRLIDAGILTEDGVTEAREWMPHMTDPCDVPSDEGRLAAAILDNLACGD